MTKSHPFRNLTPLLIAAIAILIAFTRAHAATAATTASPVVSIAADPNPGAIAAHGLAKLELALRAKGVPFERTASPAAAQGRFVIVAGLLTGTSPAAALAKTLPKPLSQTPESLVVHKLAGSPKPTWLLAGADERGLMYALLDAADRVGWAASPDAPLAELRDAAETPNIAERALSMYTMNRAYWESRFYDEAYWTRYLDLLAQNRFNSLVVICGYENGGFLAPAYPYFFDVEPFPGVRMVGLSAAGQQRNLAALKRLIALAHARGIRFTLGLWDHIYRGGVQGGGVPGAGDATQTPTPGLVWGVTADNLSPYTQAALTKLVRLVPELDAIQFRMHDESGLKKSEQEGFWRDVFTMMKKEAPHLLIDARAKGLPDSVIQTGLDVGVKLRVNTKYWMEQMGYPFHPTHINTQNQRDRRHSYADMLSYPQKFKMHWQLWNGGTARILLWGAPAYAARFAESCKLYGGDSFDVLEPLATKMEAQPHDMKPFDLLNPAARYTDYEFERYWHFFQSFGRIGYNPDTPPEVFSHVFEKRFGKDAAPSLEAALHQASWVLPRIIAACYPYSHFPTTRGWAEKQRLGDLPAYAKAEGSDIQQFESFDDEAKLLLEGGETARLRPQQTALWFTLTAAAINTQVTEAEQKIGDHKNIEFASTVVDLKILANLALFHARRIPAAVSYRLYERTKDPAALAEAIKHERNATAAWRALVNAAGDTYAPDLMLGVRGAGLCGHWRDELAKLEQGLTALEAAHVKAATKQPAKPAPRYQVAAPGDPAPQVTHRAVTSAPAGQPLTLNAKVTSPNGVKWVRLRYRAVNQTLDFATLEMKPTAEPGRYETTVPAAQIDPKFDFMYFIEAMDKTGHGRIYPDLNKETPYIIVKLQR